MGTLMDELDAEWRARLQPGSRVTVSVPFTEEPVVGVVVERFRDTVIVAVGGEDVEYRVNEVRRAR